MPRRGLTLALSLVICAFAAVSAGAVPAPAETASPARTSLAMSPGESGRRLPLRYDGEAGQVITVAAPSASSTTATLIAWTRDGDDWVAATGPIPAYVGAGGIGAASETVARTPAGAFDLTEAFGILPSNGTQLPYRHVDASDWWVSDVNSPAYNTPYRCAPGHCPFDERAGEDLGKAGTAYRHAVVIDYNRYPAVPGAGSAFFLHVSLGHPTTGCVSVPAADLDTVMRWLDPALHPAIVIGAR
jgi:L,D-peptidoglycan transpeptidase YkuD (ErfK/YbiS/YcfS/YnhG family)